MVSNHGRAGEDPYSSCVGNESAIAQCFRHLLNQKTTESPSCTDGRCAHYCDQALVLGCAAADKQGADADKQELDADKQAGGGAGGVVGDGTLRETLGGVGAGEEQPEPGVWVIGDDAGGSNVDAPVILLETGYSEECGDLTNVLCWAKILAL